MHIALVHNALIPPLKYGGTERVVYWLAEALESLGHQVTLIAKAESQIRGVKTVPFVEDWETLLDPSVDMIHLWSTPSKAPQRPFVVTIEGNGQVGEAFHPNTLFVSSKHAALHGSTHFVYNGINPQQYELSEERGNYLVFLAKANWKVKNLAGAIEIAEAAGMPLEILGSRDWPLGLNHVFQRTLGALFGEQRNLRYRGMVGDVEKRKVLRKAKALLFPVLWHEPFGVAITEALASGCPVLGTPYGSLPEIITPSVGMLSNRAQDFIDQLKGDSFHPQACRQRVSEGFTHFQMAEKYLSYYRKVLETGFLSEQLKENSPIRTLSSEPAETLLKWTPLS